MAKVDASTQLTEIGAESDRAHIKETINMLFLAVCQIEATMSDSNASVDTLTQSFTHLAEHTSSVSKQVQELSEVEQLEAFKKDIKDTAHELNLNINKSVQAFQFYDRVCQRLDHIARSLEKVSDLLGKDEFNSIESWRRVQEEIKSSYTMEAESIMFEYIMRGGTVRNALEIYRHHFNNAEDDNDKGDEIELF